MGLQELINGLFDELVKKRKVSFYAAFRQRNVSFLQVTFSHMENIQITVGDEPMAIHRSFEKGVYNIQRYDSPLHAIEVIKEVLRSDHV